MLLTRRGTIAAGLGMLAARHAAVAQQGGYPTHPITLIVPFGPGGGTDVLARLLAERLASALGQPMPVDNRPGASGTIGMAQLARARPDGYTLAIAPNGTFAMAPPLFHLSYDNDRAFAPISLLATNTMMICAHPSAPWRTLADLIAAAKAQPGRITYASAGVGVTNHLAVELLLEMAGAEMLHVPYRSAAQAAQAVMTREAALSFADASIALPFMRAGELRALAVTSAKRSAQAPEIPTAAESGLTGYQASVDLGFFAPAGTPASIVVRLSEEARRAMLSDDMKAKLSTLALDPIAGQPAEFAAYQAAESRKWSDLIRRRNIKLE